MSTEIERLTDLRKFLDERILDSKVERSLRELFRIAKEFYNSIVDLVKRKELSTELEPLRTSWRKATIPGCTGPESLQRPLYGSRTFQSQWFR